MTKTDAWDGNLWAEILEGDMREKYAALVAKLRPEDATTAKEIFQLGHKHGYQMAGDLSVD